MAEEIATVSIRQFAKDRKVSDTAIRKAINAGKIVEGRIFKNGVPCIIPEIATRELDLYEASPTRGVKKESATVKEKPRQEYKAPPVIAPASHQTAEVPKPPAGSLAAARLVQAQIKAKDMEVDLKKKIGDLVEKKRVYDQLFSFGQEIKATFQMIPDRVIDDILAAPSRNESHGILVNAIATALESLTEVASRELTPRS